MKFSNVLGHEDIKPDLEKYMDGHYLFYGPPSGKRTVAFELSKYVLCQGTKEDGCTCKSCVTFNQGHADFLCVGREEKILVEDVDRLIDFCSRAPLFSQTKAVVIDNSDVISSEAANRLLKLIEESTYTFIIVTSNIDKILPTIKSRCIKIKFNALNQETITNILWQKMGFELPQARVLGWMGIGSSLNIFSNAGQYLKARNDSIELINLLSGKDFLNVLDYISKIEEIEIFIDTFILVLTDILLIKNSLEVVICPDRLEDLKKATERLNDKAVLVLVNNLTQIKKHLYLNINASMSFKTELMKIWPVIK
jgi:DNA polymerase III subunit delta'